MDIAIIGGGMAGLTLATQLHGAGQSVNVFDKGRRPGGRLASRQEGAWRFNHGAQFFTLRDERFAGLMQRLGAAPWAAAGDARFSGVPSMAALPLAMAAALPGVRSSAHVTGLLPEDGRWTLTFKDAAPRSAGAVVLAIPAPQAAALLAPLAHPFIRQLAAVKMAPCWTAMLGFEGLVRGPEILRPEFGPIGWAARENSRPDQPPAPVSYTVQASAGWSTEHLEAAPEDVGATLTAAFAAASGISDAPAFTRVHRWRYALAETPLGVPFLWDKTTKLGLCGDWCLAGRLEAAFLSATALGIELANDL